MFKLPTKLVEYFLGRHCPYTFKKFVYELIKKLTNFLNIL